jgi:hypothetical protein
MENTCSHDRSFHALVKFEVFAAHFSGAYEFVHYTNAGQAGFVWEVWVDFTARVEEEAGLLDARYDEENKKVLSELSAASERYMGLAKAGELRDPREMNSSATVGYPTYSFEVLAAGPAEEFVPACVKALGDDDEIESFCEEWADEDDEEDEEDDEEGEGDEDDSDEDDDGNAEYRKLAAELTALRESGGANISLERLLACLSEIEELVRKDMG